MHLRKLVIRNVKCFERLELSFLDSTGKVRPWTALLGQNGLGKSTVLQSMAIALAGPGAIRELIPVAEGWTRASANYGEIEAELDWTDGDAQVEGWPKKTPYTCRYIVTGYDPEKLPESIRDQAPTVPSILDWSGIGTPREREAIGKAMARLKRTAYAEGKTGWLACGYGPFRRLSGGSQDADRILYSGRKAARFVTLFREDAALTNATEWIISLHNTGRDGDQASIAALETVKQAFADRLLPERAELYVDARSARLKIGNREAVPFQHLSDGYRSMLALGIDLLRWIITAFPEHENPREAPGVVLIDELDAHLHPYWQQQIGQWLPEKFPNVQFVVATHSPFLAQVATEPGGNIVLAPKGDTVEIAHDQVAVNAWRADQILVELFGLKTTRSPQAERRLLQYLALEEKRRTRSLSPEEEDEWKQLSFQFENLPPSIEDPEERAVASILKSAVRKHESELKTIE